MNDQDIENVVDQLIEELGVFTQSDAEDVMDELYLSGTVRTLEEIGELLGKNPALGAKFTEVMKVCDSLLSRLTITQ